jgi:hypothetical protein
MQGSTAAFDNFNAVAEDGAATAMGSGLTVTNRCRSAGIASSAAALVCPQTATQCTWKSTTYSSIQRLPGLHVALNVVENVETDASIETLNLSEARSPQVGPENMIGNHRLHQHFQHPQL